ncbi:hypothetical protein HRbin02_00789 [Candidatus Calditenuaceae archaeon HR02]|nr:hypothetical protein HRbin02_00789 [Candidatus Calditenuaceae archaeon HR02]
MGRAGRPLQTDVDPLRELERSVRAEGSHLVVGHEILLKESFRVLRLKQITERFPSLLVRFRSDHNPWIEDASLLLRKEIVLLTVRVRASASVLVEAKDVSLELMMMLSRRGFLPSWWNENAVTLKLSAKGRERIGDLVLAVRKALRGLLKRAEMCKKELERKVDGLVRNVMGLDGARLVTVRTASLVVEMLLSSVYPEIVAYLVFAVEPKYEKAHMRRSP